MTQYLYSWGSMLLLTCKMLIAPTLPVCVCTQSCWQIVSCSLILRFVDVNDVNRCPGTFLDVNAKLRGFGSVDATDLTSLTVFHKCRDPSPSRAWKSGQSSFTETVTADSEAFLSPLRAWGSGLPTPIFTPISWNTPLPSGWFLPQEVRPRKHTHMLMVILFVFGCGV